jgi:tRNA U34 5-methylaminomethyl-2-thiouridine-forming methyltransferase MnmC
MSEPLSAVTDTYTHPSDFSISLTRDGSYTLYSHALDERYHSVHGAVQESFHVFIRMGLEALAGGPVRVLEVGLGTGLNMLLTWVEADLNERMVSYTALEPYPVPTAALEAMDHARALDLPERSKPFLELMAFSEGAVAAPSSHFRFQRSAMKVQELEGTEAFDLIYFDAFGPANQPEMWTLGVFQRMFRALAPGGMLVTYCAKGVVRRTMQAAGFTVDRVPGPLGKKEMLRATKPQG